MSETKSNPSSAASSTPSTISLANSSSSTPSATLASAATNLNPAEFTVEFLRNQTSVRLNEIKKANKIRKKADQDLVDAIAEWYQKNYGPESATVSATPKTRKPRAKKTTSDAGTMANTIGVATTLEDSIRAEVAQDAAGGETVSETPKTKAKKPQKVKQPEPTSEELEKYKQSLSITREALRDKVHQIHNLLRNTGI